MHSQLHLVYNNEVAFQKRIESLLSKYHSYLNNPDELTLFTSDSCQYITSEVIKYDFQIYNYLGRLDVHLVNSLDLVERQKLQELMVLFNINKVKPSTNGYTGINKKNVNVGGYNNKGRIEKSSKIRRHKSYFNNKSNNNNNEYAKKFNNKFQNKPNNNNNKQ
ncbi:hypothetical protein ABK040_005999 [Willaertia magna]